MKLATKRIAIVIVVLLTLVGCRGIGEPATTDSPDYGFEAFLRDLRTRGFEADPLDTIEQPFFSVEARVVQMGEAEIQVFEYESFETRDEDSDLIPEAGTPIGPTMVDWISQPNFWAKGRLIVLYVGTDQEIIRSITDILGQPLTSHSAIEEPLPPLAAIQARAALAERLQLNAEAIAFNSYERVDWPDACLGLSSEGEMCAEVITPGYKVVLQAEGEQYEAHTDEAGKQVRFADLEGDS